MKAHKTNTQASINSSVLSFHIVSFIVNPLDGRLVDYSWLINLIHKRVICTIKPLSEPERKRFNLW